MADSGLETGSFSLQEATESENSGTDFEECHITDYTSTDDDFIRVAIACDPEKPKPPVNPFEKCEPRRNRRGQDPASGCSSREDATYDPEATKYKSQVDPFYDSDGNDNDPGSSFVPTSSFEFIEPINSETSPCLSHQKYILDSGQEEKTRKPEASSVISENLHELTHSNDPAPDLGKILFQIGNRSECVNIDICQLNTETQHIQTQNPDTCNINITFGLKLIQHEHN